jgi:hypothetical protein
MTKHRHVRGGQGRSGRDIADSAWMLAILFAVAGLGVIGYLIALITWGAGCWM